ncbi:MAG: potassium channel family protein [Verrucomicrobia bacterium]|nr:potassium channel family protein [Verrucomicrobiota bacterium]
MHPLHRHILNLAERRHVIGGLTLLGLFYFGPYLPTELIVLVFLAVACMAVTTHADTMKVAVVASGSFLVSLMVYWLNGWKSLAGEVLTFGQATEEASVLMVLATLIFGTISWIKRLLNTKNAKLDKILEACNLYVWIGGTFALLYTIVERINNHAFRHSQFMPAGSVVPTVSEWRNDVQQMLYFSFVTQTTLGFGDILPATHIARVLTITQAVIGQFYVALVLTYILSLWIHDLGSRIEKKGSSSDSQEGHHKQG